jgi:hypothetical protein
MTKLAEEITQSPATTRPPIYVRILDDFGHVDKEEVAVKPGQEVVWVHEGKQVAEIVFRKQPEGAPFGAESYVARPGTSAPSGPPKDHAIGRKKYKYRVNKNDPIVIIDK